MMNKNNKRKVMATMAGVVGAGAVIASAVAMTDKKNRKKVKEVVSKTKVALDKYSDEMQDRVEKGKKNLREFANATIETVEKVTKAAKEGVQKYDKTC